MNNKTNINKWVGHAGERAMGDEEVESLKTLLEKASLGRSRTLDKKDTEDAVATFEKKIAQISQRKYAIAMNSGTSAMDAAFEAIGISQGDEVIVSGYGWITTISCLVRRGAIPVFASIDADLTLRASSLASLVNKKTKAIVVVHALGAMSDMKEIGEIAKSASIPIIEDACQAMGTSLEGVPAGSFGDISVFSFQSRKVLSAGEGGVALCNCEKLYDRMLRFHDAGLNRYSHLTTQNDSKDKSILNLGFNFRMGQLNATLLNVQIKKLEFLQKKLNQSKSIYLKALWPLFDESLAYHQKAKILSKENGTTVLLHFRSYRLAKSFQQLMIQNKIPSVHLADDPLHTFMGWREILQKQNIEYRDESDQRSEDYLCRSICIDVNWKIENIDLDFLNCIVSKFAKKVASNKIDSSLKKIEVQG